MIEFCILGSGMAGSTIANLLSKKSSVKIFDKARGAGGRSSNRRFRDGASFDHGLQYICPKNKLFKKFLINLEKKKSFFMKSKSQIKPQNFYQSI